MCPPNRRGWFEISIAYRKNPTQAIGIDRIRERRSTIESFEVETVAETSALYSAGGFTPGHLAFIFLEQQSLVK